MTFDPLPVAAAWRHGHSREGLEVTAFLPKSGGYEISGSTNAVEGASIWSVSYTIEVDHAWLTRRARVTSRHDGSTHEVILETDGAGGWLINGNPDPTLDGCLDVDLESSAMTNTLPVHRLNLPVGNEAAAPAAYVAVENLRVHRLEQSYYRESNEGSGHQYRYTAPEFEFTARLQYDQSGLITHYPHIADRAG